MEAVRLFTWLIVTDGVRNSLAKACLIKSGKELVEWLYCLGKVVCQFWKWVDVLGVDLLQNKQTALLALQLVNTKASTK